MGKIEENDSTGNQIGMHNKFRTHLVHADTKVLILGTFHPELNQTGDFFYSGAGNFFWKILPSCFEEDDLRKKGLGAKKEFMARHGIDFADIIHSLKPGYLGEKLLYGDEYIDAQVDRWNGVEKLIDILSGIEAVYFTRKTFNRLPFIEERVAQIRNHCVENRIRFSLLETPAHHFDLTKKHNWKMTIINKTICR